MRIRVMSYNIHRAIGMDRRFRLERIAAVLDHHQADIVLLQEVDVGVPRSRGLDLARELAEQCGYPYRAVGLNVTLRQGRYGNATLSRVPLVQERNIDLTVGRRKPRGCLFTVAEPSSGRRLALFNVHLGLSFKERPRQVGMLVHSPEFQALGRDDPCLVAGDFNDWWTRLAPMLTEILDFQCASNRPRGYQNPILTYPSFSPTSGLDKIFVRGTIEVERCWRCRLRVSRVASDHLPLLADLRLPF